MTKRWFKKKFERNELHKSEDFRRKSASFRILPNLSIVTWFIIVNTVVFIIEFTSIIVNPDYIDYFALKPSNILNGDYLWTLFTHMFSHVILIHLFINMFVLFSLGSLCEKIIGRKRFFWFYIISGLFAGILSVLLAGYFGYGVGERIFGSANVHMIGASGAIFAIAGLFVVLLPRLRFAIIFLPFFSLPAYVMVPIVLFITWLVSVLANLPIGNVAHFGGFLAGLIYGFYLRAKYRRKIAVLQRLFR